MADNIKIVGNILSTTTVSRYSNEDTNLISSKKLQENFGGENDYIEYYAYDIGGTLLYTNYNYLSYKLPPSIGLTPGTTTTPNTTGNIQTEHVGVVSTLSPQTSSLYPIIEIDPVKDLQDLGYSSGEFNIKYNFFTNTLSNYINEALFIKEISQDRTEIRLASTTLTNDEIETVVNSMIDKINNSTYYVDYLLNFGNNEQYVAINVALNKAITGYEVLFKLYQPLPLSVQEKQTLWIVEEKVNSYGFDINLDKIITPPPPPTLRGPNFDIPINSNQGTVSSQYNTYTNLISGLQTLQSSSYHRILNLLTSQSVDINVDYTDFNNFSFFGSAYQRLVNFYNKIKEIETYNTFITTYNSSISTTSSLQTTINQYSSSINNIISEFDGYESYLYFESSSYAWPKLGSSKPYILLSPTSSTVLSWYNNLTSSAQDYDLNNYNNLEYAIPDFIKNDENNQPFLTFLNMVGHYFDNIWIYLKAITDINLANNNLNYGISKDLVYSQLQSLGLKLYNSQAGESTNQYLVGANTGSSVWNNNTTITGSYLNNIPRKDLVSELYKRIYHNLPLLLKQKGTVAGLESLITTFGIPSKPYVSLNGSPCALYEVYCYDTSVDSQLLLLYCGETYASNWASPPSTVGPTFTDYIWVDTSYPITISAGSAVTLTLINTGNTTILNVKEFGGGNKAELINGYNNDKVRIIDNSIVSNTIYSGSVLSPFHSLQTFPTESAKFRENDMHYVDISFSPETQIDAYISGAIASNNPTWSLDDYIGDPRQQYNSSYADLDAQRKLYFETGVPGYAPFTASLLDYNGFIRLVEYFDNSLFKMLADFVPERTSLSTGVTINSPVLERNKVAYNIPSATTQSVPTAEYSASGISSTYGAFYNALSSSNNTMGWYDGELSGSTVNIYQYFQDNYNPYLLGNTASYNAWHPANQQVDYNTFLHSDWNVLLNNVFNNVKSIYRNTLDLSGKALVKTTRFGVPIYQEILYPSELQDSYLFLQSHNNSRYSGCKTTSLLYNKYSSASGSYSGDKSYGKTAAIDHTVRKIGLFTQIESSSYLPKRNSVRLKYLVNEFGDLTELNQINKNWCDVQRTFIMGDTGSISLFDNRKYSNQKSTDGNKVIFDSGYLYTPILYGSGRDTRLYFENITEDSTFYAKSINLSSSIYISGSPNPSFPVVGGYVQNLFNNIVQNDGNMYAGSGSSFPSYSIVEGGQYNVDATFDITLKMNSIGSASFTLEAYSGSTLVQSDTQTFQFASATPLAPNGYAGYVVSSSQSSINGSLIKSVRPITIGGITYPTSSDFYVYGGVYQSQVGCSPSTLISPGYRPLESTIQLQAVPGCDDLKQLKKPVYYIPEFNIPPVNGNVTKTFGVSLSRQSLNQGNQISLKLSQSYTTTANYTASISQGSFIVASVAVGLSSYPYVALVPNQYFDDEMWDPTFLNTEDEIILSPALASFYSPRYQFLPTITSGSVTYTSSLYSTYGDIDYPFQLNPFDIFAAYDNSGSYFESRVLYVYQDANLGNFVRIKLTDSIPYSLRQDLTNLPTKPNIKFLFIKRVEDETSIYIKFQKRNGLTSYGFIIPENLAPDILANINTITSQVKTKLLNEQGNVIGDVNGGTFGP
jgi:hypothetical protein